MSFKEFHKNRIWSEEDLLFLKNNYANCKMQDLMAKLGRSQNSIFNTAKKFNLKRKSLHSHAGDRFGRLILLEKLPKKSSPKTKWLCKCDCGKTHEVNQAQLRDGSVKSCGCLATDEKRMPIGDSSFIRLLNTYVKNARNRDYVFELTFEQFKNLVSQNCTYCNSEPIAFNRYIKSDGKTLTKEAKAMTQEGIDRSTIKANGIDRKINQIGYILDNCVPCCEKCNRMKLHYGEDIFLAHIEKIYNFSIKK